MQGKFLSFYQFAKTFNTDDFDYEELKNTDFVFMRWKVIIMIQSQLIFYHVNKMLIAQPNCS